MAARKDVLSRRISVSNAEKGNAGCEAGAMLSGMENFHKEGRSGSHVGHATAGKPDARIFDCKMNSSGLILVIIDTIDI
jgi:hypothetical protein